MIRFLLLDSDKFKRKKRRLMNRKLIAREPLKGWHRTKIAVQQLGFPKIIIVRREKK